MAIYGYVRCSPLKAREVHRSRRSNRLRKRPLNWAAGWSGRFVEHGNASQKTAILARSAGKEMLETLTAGDTLIVARLDRLGYSMRDVHKTAAKLGERGVRIYALHAIDGELDLEPGIAKVILQLFALWAKTDRVLRSERFCESARWRKENGLAYGGVPPRGGSSGGTEPRPWNGTGSNCNTSPRLPTGSRGKAPRRWPRTFGSGGSRTGGVGYGASRCRKPSAASSRSTACCGACSAREVELSAPTSSFIGRAVVLADETEGTLAAPVWFPGGINGGPQRFSERA